MAKKTEKKPHVNGEKLSVIFSCDGRSQNFANGRDNSLLVPDSLFDIPVSLSGLTQSPYRIDRKFNEENPTSQLSQTVYAPFPLGIWALFAIRNGHINKLILDDRRHYSHWRLLWLLLALKNEKRRMGSDVFSPLMTHQLRKRLSIADYFSLNIGDWLRMMAKIPHHINSFSSSIFWLDNNTSPDKLRAFISRQ